MSTGVPRPNFRQPMLHSLGELLSPPGAPLVVPDYQRSYSWEARQAEEFWTDITEFAENVQLLGPTYFLGVVVLVEGESHEILDGQQRIATATIMLASLAKFLDEAGESSKATQIRQDHIVAFDQFGGSKQYRIEMNRYDRLFYRRLVQDGEVVEPSSQSPQSHRNIAGCWELFNRRLRQWEVDFDRGEAVSKASRLFTTLRDRVFVMSLTAIEFNDAGDAFEKLNDRGISLSTVDLVRMLMIRRGRTEDREEIVETWRQILSTDSSGNIEDLLRYHWITLEGDPTSNRLYRVIAAKFDGSCKRQDHGRRYAPLQFTNQLARASEIYSDIRESVVGDGGYASVAATVVDLNVRPLIPLLMKLYDMDDEVKDRVATVAMNCYVRNLLIGGQSSTDFESLVYRVAHEIQASSFSEHSEELEKRMSDDGRFFEDFCKARISVVKRASYLLRCIETHLREETEGGIGELEVRAPSDVHVEHIYPKKPSFKHWDDHVEWVHRLGNMTLLGSSRNIRARNFPFRQKKTVYADSKLELTKALMNTRQWTPKRVEQRQQWMAELAVKVWPKES